MYASALLLAKPITLSARRIISVSSSTIFSSVDHEMSEHSGDPDESQQRLRSVVFMALAMALHFGGYEFFRNSCLALFTSSDYGFRSPAAFPLAQGLVSPFSVVMLWAYGNQLENGGPRLALRNTTLFSVAFIAFATVALCACRQLTLPLLLSKLIIGMTFLFQNSYQYLLYTQQWSFVGSVLTPDEGSRWYSVIIGFSSALSTLTGSLVSVLAPMTGLLGLMLLTSVTLTGSLILSDKAYDISEKHGFNPANQRQREEMEEDNDKRNGLSKAVALFRGEATLAALLAETLSFQCLNTILSTAFVRALKETITDDVSRSAYSGRLYALINAVSALSQFALMPSLMKRMEPRLLWRLMPLFPLVVCITQAFRGSLSLTLLAIGFFASKTQDYSMRSVISMLAYQPLSFESRFVGKEVIGILGSRFGKSGMSMVLSGLTTLGLTGLRELSYLSVVACLLWTTSTWSLSLRIPSKDEAQATVEKRSQEMRKDIKQE